MYQSRICFSSYRFAGRDCDNVKKSVATLTCQANERENSNRDIEGVGRDQNKMTSANPLVDDFTSLLILFSSADRKSSSIKAEINIASAA